MKKILIFIGPPGSGKGTQAKKIAYQNNYAHISTGALLRARLESHNYPPDEARVLSKIREGHLVPDWLVYRLTFMEIEKQLRDKAGVVLDGAIRSLDQAKKFQEYFVANNLAKEVQAVYIALTDEESYNRLTKRRVCADCRANIPWSKETRELTQCPHCKGQLQKRLDDTEEVIRERIKIQGNRVLKPILDFYQGLGILVEVEGNQEIETVARAVRLALIK